MLRYREPNRKDWIKTVLYITAYIVAVCGGALLVLPLGGAGALLWAVIVLGGLVLLVGWHTRNAAYRCTKCGHEFEIPLMTDLMSPHGISNGGWKYLKCPRCNERMRARVLVKETGGAGR